MGEVSKYQKGKIFATTYNAAMIKESRTLILKTRWCKYTDISVDRYLGK